MDLITLQEYKDFYGKSLNTSEDGRYSMLITMISSLIQTYLDQDFEGGKTYTEVQSLDYLTNVIYLEHYPVVTPVIVEENDRYTQDSTIHVPLVYGSEYILNAEEGTLTRQYTSGGFANWPLSPASVTITYTTAPTWGITEDTVPADLKLACIELVTYYYKEEYRQSKTIGGTSVVNTLAKGTEFPLHIQVILDKYLLK